MNVHLNMACRDGFLQRSCLKQYSSNTGGKSWSIMAGNYLGFWVGFLTRARNSVDRLRFPFVQSEILMCSFGWCKYELPDFFLEKVMGASNFYPW